MVHLSYKASMRLLDIKLAYQTLIADGDLITPINLKACKYLTDNNKNAKCEAKYLIRVEQKIDELQCSQVQTDIGLWLCEYVMCLPDDPFEALFYDQIVTKVFSGEFKLH